MDPLTYAVLMVSCGLAAGLAKVLMPSDDFDHKKLKKYSIEAIAEFAKSHQNETFYGFSIDATMLCLNSEEAFKKTQKSYRKGGLDLSSELQCLELKRNTGDWEYQGFADLQKSGGFDLKAYEQHYDKPRQSQSRTPYARAMDKLVKDLIEANAFACLRTTDDFFANRVEHDL
jgi:hypothetical protein